MVTIRSPALTALSGIEHERRISPLICTEQAPHCATPQPYLVPVSPTCSRMTHSRGVSASTSTSRGLPLILSFAIERPPASLENGCWVGSEPGTLAAPRLDRSIAHGAARCLRQFAALLN